MEIEAAYGADSVCRLFCFSADAGWHAGASRGQRQRCREEEESAYENCGNRRRRDGRRTEVDTISGSVVRAGRKNGVPAPLHEAMVRFVHAMENRKA
ncbi:MAG: hypothetical protein IJN79_11100 [Clostridia bacterium]|nr:hypothetical protein [Clostridia bacterium]MBQ7053327.1 hypothetical protein [Clostridia bacterium]